MKRSLVLAAGAAALVALGVVPALATGGVSPVKRPVAVELTAASEVPTAAPQLAVADARPAEPKPAPERHEDLRLACAVDRGPAVQCHWSESQHPNFAAYRLVRGDGKTRN